MNLTLILNVILIIYFFLWTIFYDYSCDMYYGQIFLFLRKELSSFFCFMLVIVFIYIRAMPPMFSLIIGIIFTALFLVCFIIMICFTIVLILDIFYRPNIEQYPFNIIVDRIVPIVFLFSPLIIAYFVSVYYALDAVFCFSLVIFLHILIVLPTLHYWSKLRSWNTNNMLNIWSWSHPKIYKHIGIAILYPLIWGFYFSILRYIRLGSSIKFSFDYSFISFDWVFILIVLFFFYSIWLRLLFWSFSHLKDYLWSEFYVLFYSLHLKFLQYNIYFYSIEKLYKFSYLWFSYMIRKESIYGYSRSLPNILIPNIYKYSIIFNFLLFFFVILEIFISKTLYYSIYFLFVYPIIFFIFRFLNDFACFNWVEVVNASDYLAKNFNKPRYPIEFWHNFDTDTYRGGFHWDFNDKQLEVINKIAAPFLAKKPYNFSHEYAFTKKVMTRPWSFRLAAAYRLHSSVRWVHTEPLKAIPSFFHKASVFFVRSSFDAIALINNSWKHYPTILKVESLHKPYLFNYPLEIYKTINLSHNNDFRSFLEANTPTNFADLCSYSVNSSLYNGQMLSFKDQPNPDVVVDFKNSSFSDKRIHALDLKAVRQPGIGRSKLLSQITHDNYSGVIKNFIIHADKTSIKLSVEALNALNQLVLSANNLSHHQFIWAKSLHLFPVNYIPPVKVPNNFSLQDLKPEFLEKINIANLRMHLVSNYLYLKKIPQTENIFLSKDMLDILNHSEIQRIFSENPI